MLKLQIPENFTSSEMIELGLNLFIYLVSYIYIGIYCSNHQHLFHTVKKVNVKVLLINLALLFFLSLIPFATKWLTVDMGTVSLLFHGVCLILSAIAYLMYVRELISENEVTKKRYENSKFKKKIISVVIYLLGLILAFIYYPVSLLACIIVAIIWIVPDKKIEEHLKSEG